VNAAESQQFRAESCPGSDCRYDDRDDRRANQRCNLQLTDRDLVHVRDLRQCDRSDRCSHAQSSNIERERLHQLGEGGEIVLLSDTSFVFRSAER